MNVLGTPTVTCTSVSDSGSTLPLLLTYPDGFDSHYMVGQSFLLIGLLELNHVCSIITPISAFDSPSYNFVKRNSVVLNCKELLKFGCSFRSFIFTYLTFKSLLIFVTLYRLRAYEFKEIVQIGFICLLGKSWWHLSLFAYPVFHILSLV